MVDVCFWSNFPNGSLLFIIEPLGVGELPKPAPMKYFPADSAIELNRNSTWFSPSSKLTPKPWSGIVAQNVISEPSMEEIWNVTAPFGMEWGE